MANIIDLNIDKGDPTGITEQQYNRMRTVLGIQADRDYLEALLTSTIDNSLTPLQNELTDHIEETDGAHAASAILLLNNDTVQDKITAIDTLLGIESNRINNLISFRNNIIGASSSTVIIDSAIADAFVTTRMIDDQQITRDKIKDSAINNSKVDDNADIDGTKINTDFGNKTIIADALIISDTATLPVDTQLNGNIPIGGIIMWSGLLENIPANWALCNGSDGTPDLRGRFIVGYAPNDSEYDSISNKGGAKNVQLTEAQMPSHTHTHVISGGAHSHNVSGTIESRYHHGDGTYVARSGRNDSGPKNISNGIKNLLAGQSGSVHTHDLTIHATGGNQAHENRPPYFVLAFIIRIT